MQLEDISLIDRENTGSQQPNLLDKNIEKSNVTIDKIRKGIRYWFYWIMALGSFIIATPVYEYINIKFENTQKHIDHALNFSNGIELTMGKTNFIGDASKFFYKTQLEMNAHWMRYNIIRPPAENSSWNFTNDFSTEGTSLATLVDSIESTKDPDLKSLLEFKNKIIKKPHSQEEHLLQESLHKDWSIKNMWVDEFKEYLSKLKKFDKYYRNWKEIFIYLDSVNNKITWVIKLLRTDLSISKLWDKCSDCHKQKMYPSNLDKSKKPEDYVYLEIEHNLTKLLNEIKNEILKLFGLQFIAFLWMLFWFRKLWKYLDDLTEKMLEENRKLKTEQLEAEKQRNKAEQEWQGSEILTELMKISLIRNQSLEWKLKRSIDIITNYEWLKVSRKWSIFLKSWEYIQMIAQIWLPDLLAWATWICKKMLIDPNWCVCQRVAASKQLKVIDSIDTVDGKWNRMHIKIHTPNHWHIAFPIIDDNDDTLLWVIDLFTKPWNNTLNEKEKVFLQNIAIAIRVIIEEHEKNEIIELHQLLISKNPWWMMIFKLEEWELKFNWTYNNMGNYLVSSQWKDSFVNLISSLIPDPKQFIYNDQVTVIEQSIWDKTYEIDIKASLQHWVLCIYLKDITERINILKQLEESYETAQLIIDVIPEALRTIRNWPLPTDQSEIDKIDNFDLHQKIWEMSYVDIVNNKYASMFWGTKEELQWMSIFDSRIIDRKNAEMLASRILDFKNNKYESFNFDLNLKKLNWETFIARISSTLFTKSPIWWIQAATIIRDITEETEQFNKIMYEKSHCPLTDLLIKPPFMNVLDRQCKKSAQNTSIKKRVTDKPEKVDVVSDKTFLILLDLDHFKPVNDTYWHTLWDKLLVEVANRIKNCCRNSDPIARLWWDEFGIIAIGTNLEWVETLARKIKNSLSQPFDIDWTPIKISASIWISICPDHWLNQIELYEKADRATYVSKHNGRGRFTFFDKDKTPTIETLKAMAEEASDPDKDAENGKNPTEEKRRKKKKKWI